MMMMMMMILMILIKGAGRGILQNHCSKPSHNIIHCRCIWSYLIRNTQNYIGRSKSITKQNWFQFNSWLIDKPQFWREREGLEVPVRPDFFPNGPHQSEIFHHEKSCHEEILPEGINWVENIQLFANNKHCTHSERFALNYANAMAQLRTNNGHLVLEWKNFLSGCVHPETREIDRGQFWGPIHHDSERTFSQHWMSLL